MSIRIWLHRQRSCPRWMKPPLYLLKAIKFLWALLSCAFGIAAALIVPSPFGGILLVFAGGTVVASKSPKVWFDSFILKGYGALLYASIWVLVGLVLCINHYFQA